MNTRAVVIDQALDLENNMQYELLVPHQENDELFVDGKFQKV